MENIKSYLEEYENIRQTESVLKKRKEEVSAIIKEYVMVHGTKDSNGSSYCDDDKYVYGSQCRKSVKLNHDKAKDFFTEKGLYEKVVTYVEQIDESAIESLIIEGDISEDDLEKFVDIKTSYAVSLKVKKQAEDMPEVEVVSNLARKRLMKRK